MCLYKLCIVLIYLCVNIQVISGRTVLTSVGTISGVVGEEFTSYLGIPYGVVSEEKPFDTATPAPAFNTTYIADKDPVICPQIVKDIPQGSIHCLNLNVYTPNNITANSSLSVMVFIHGGGFVEGDGNLNTYSPKFLIRRNVIIVTLNYRLGPYGFLCLPKANYSNQGLKDQALAFDWVKRNIKYFGGNDSDVTMFAHSAGSMSAEIHLLFNKNKLFNKVILQSGFAASGFLNQEAANEDYIKKIAKELNFDGNNTNVNDILKELANIDGMKLINMSRYDLFRPCIDEVFINKTASVNLKGIKVMLGTVTKEMLFLYKDDKSAYQFFNYLPEQSIVQVKKHYLKGHLKDDAVDFGSDFAFHYPAERSERFYKGNADAVYRYLFAYDGGRNFIKLRDNITSEGATHGDELGYLFDADFLVDNITAADQEVIDAMADSWTNFAKYGNPDKSWPAVGKINYYKKIGPKKITIEKNYFKDKIEFWDKYYSMYGSCMKSIDFGEEYDCMEKGAGNKSSISSLSVILSIVIGLLLLKYHE